MEFGIFSNGYTPGPAAHDSESEHTELMREAEYAILADKHNWKYIWFGEHHGLTEYSHMSAPAPIMGWVAAQTDYIHIGSAITSLPTNKEHPVRIAERAAMLDHVTNNRFEFGTGRGAGSHELRTFNVMDPSVTKAQWDEVIREIPRMWEQKDYDFDGLGGETFWVDVDLSWAKVLQNVTKSHQTPRYSAKASRGCADRAACTPLVKQMQDWNKYRSSLEPAGKFCDLFVKKYGSTMCADIQQVKYGRCYKLREADDLKAFQAAGATEKCSMVVKSGLPMAADVILDRT
jgi:hypothetical protein